MDKVFDYAIKHLERTIEFNKAYGGRAAAGSKAHTTHFAKVAELEKELERVKELQKAAIK